MGIATPPLPPIFSQEQSISTTHKPNSANSMSQDYHHQQGIFSFSNGFERSTQQEQQQQQQQQHIAQQIRRDKLRVQGYEPPPPLVAIDEEESGGLTPVYETAGMLSEMFNFPPGAELLEQQQIPQNYHRSPQRPQPPPPPAAASNMEWYRQGMATVGGLGPLDISNDSKNHHHHHQHNQNINNRQISNINAESAAAAMQLFLMNPQPRSPSPPPPPATSSTLHMLLPNPSSNSLQGFHQVGSVIQQPSQFTWGGDHGHEGSHTTHSSAASQLNKFGEIGGVVEGQGLSLSLSSSLQHLEAAKAEELRMGDGTAAAMLFFNQGGSGAGAGQSSSSSHNYPYNKNIQHHHQSMHLQGGSVGHQNHQVHVGFGSSIGVVNVMRNSRYVKAAQELLEEFCSVGRGQFKKNKFGARHNNTNPNSNPSASGGGGGGVGSGGGGGSSSSSKDLPPLSASDRIEHQRRKVKLLSMLDEVDRRYNHYCEQMQMVVNSFDLVMGFGAAVPYTALAQKAMSRHFRCLKDAISAQLKHSYEVLGEKDGAGSSGVTKGETPRLRMLEQSLRQQRAFHQMGMMEQEAWRPQRGLPERSVNILRAWLFEHFLHPYPSDADKHLLARQTGLSRNQVSNWFINARVRLWKPMVEEMYQQESKEDDQERDIDDDDEEEEREIRSQSSSGLAQTPTPTTTTITTTASATGKRSEINATESDPSSLIAINRHCFSENQAKQAAPPNSTTTTNNLPPPVSQCFGSTTYESAELHHHHHHRSSSNNNNRLAVDDTCRRGSIIAAADHYGTTSAGGNGNVHHHADIGSTLIRFGTTAGDVSLTLGLRHAGNMAGDKPFFS